MGWLWAGVILFWEVCDSGGGGRGLWSKYLESTKKTVQISSNK